MEIADNEKGKEEEGEWLTRENQNRSPQDSFYQYEPRSPGLPSSHSNDSESGVDDRMMDSDEAIEVLEDYLGESGANVTNIRRQIDLDIIDEGLGDMDDDSNERIRSSEYSHRQSLMFDDDREPLWDLMDPEHLKMQLSPPKKWENIRTDSEFNEVVLCRVRRLASWTQMMIQRLMNQEPLLRCDFHVVSILRERWEDFQVLARTELEPVFQLTLDDKLERYTTVCIGAHVFWSFSRLVFLENIQKIQNGKRVLNERQKRLLEDAELKNDDYNLEEALEAMFNEWSFRSERNEDVRLVMMRAKDLPRFCKGWDTVVPVDVAVLSYTQQQFMDAIQYFTCQMRNYKPCQELKVFFTLLIVRYCTFLSQPMSEDHLDAEKMRE